MGYYCSEDTIRVRTVLKYLIFHGDYIRVGTLFETELIEDFTVFLGQYVCTVGEKRIEQNAIYGVKLP